MPQYIHVCAILHMFKGTCDNKNDELNTQKYIDLYIN